MIEKLTNKAISFLNTKARTSMRVVYIYGSCLLSLVLLNVIAWLYMWYLTDVPDIDKLLRITDELSKPSVVAAVTFVSVFCVNKNHDGRPDAAEVLAKRGGTGAPTISLNRRDDAK